MKVKFDSLYSKGISLSNLESKKEAINVFDQALDIKPGDYDSLYHKGISLSNLGSEKEAIKVFDQALDIKPGDYDSLYRKGLSFSNLKEDDEAIKVFDDALKIKSGDFDSLYHKGISLSNLESKKEAINVFDQALDIKPDDYDSLYRKGDLLNNLGNEEEAIKFVEKALQIKPNDWNALILKVSVLEKLDRISDAMKILKMLYQNPDAMRYKKDWINFKLNTFEMHTKPATSENLKKSSDILNEVINAFEDKKNDLFESMKKMESDFKDFTDTKRSIPVEFPSFLSVLRRWNSFTPIIPSEKGDNKGGGYFLHHAGKGIVIDPGFNFIENFYQEGFKIADIDAVLITHAHNDHTVDLESILTLVYKHNDAIEDCVEEKMKNKEDDEIAQAKKHRIKDHGKKIDLFLNVGTFMKYSGWLNLKDSGEINNVTVLQPDTTYKLSENYGSVVIHTIKAKHHEIIDDKYAIGLIFDLEGVKVGFTGDTGWDFENNENISSAFIEHKPRLVVAHLGSIKKSEFNYSGAKDDQERNKCFYAHHCV